MEIVTSVLFGIIGFIIIGVVALRPKTFWPLLIFVAVGTAGLMIKGYCFVDEYLVGCILLGGLLAILRGSLIPPPLSSPVPSPLILSPTGRGREGEGEKIGGGVIRLHQCIFLLMVVYMLIQSLHGIMLWQDWRIIRWVLYYSVLGALSFLLFRKSFPIPEGKKMALLVSLSALLYFGSYLAYGLFCENVRGIDRFTLQGIEWSGSAYAVFPLVIALPSAIFLLKDNIRYQYLGWIALILMLITGFYYDSRISLLAALLFLPISIFAIRFKKTVIFIICFIVIFAFASHSGWVLKPRQYIKKLCESSCALWSPQPADMDRNIHLRASFAAVGSNWKTLVFGYGIHSHHYVLGRYLQPLYAKYLPNVKIKKIVRTMGFPALLIDTGWLGILLLIMNFLFVAYEIFSYNKRRFTTYLLWCSLSVTFLWLLVSNIQDIMLFYLMIMPGGLLALLSET